MASQSTINRQGRGAALDADEASEVLRLLRDDATRNYDHYVWMLNDSTGEGFDPDRVGVARELARMNLTLNSYTQWYWKTNLHNLLGFLRLRADQHAQFEIRAYAEVIMGVVERWVPLTFEAFTDYKLESISLSKQGLALVRRMLAGERIDQKNSGLPASEWKQLAVALQLPSEHPGR